MGSFLLDSWTRGFPVEDTRDEASVSAVRVAVRDVSRQQGLADPDAAALATAASELAHNQLSHARLGVVGVRAIDRAGVPGVEIVAADRGPGIVDPQNALLGLGASDSGLGVGLAGVRRLSHEMDVDVRRGEGTCIWVRSFADTVVRTPEVGIYGRALETESTSGDGACFARHNRQLLLALADGLGHGDAARIGSHTVLEEIASDPWDELETLAERADRAAAGTRGAVLGLARIDTETSSVHYLVVGDIRGEVTRIDNVQRFITAPGYLGTNQRLRLRAHRLPLAAGDLVLLCSDGINSRLDLSDEKQLLGQVPVVIAQAVVTRHAKQHDDAIVAVVR